MFLRNGRCTICQNKLHQNSNKKSICEKCKTEWYHDALSGVLRFVKFDGKNKKEDR